MPRRRIIGEGTSVGHGRRQTIAICRRRLFRPHGHGLDVLSHRNGVSPRHAQGGPAGDGGRIDVVGGLHRRGQHATRRRCGLHGRALRHRRRVGIHGRTTKKGIYRGLVSAKKGFHGRHARREHESGRGWRRLSRRRCCCRWLRLRGWGRGRVCNGGCGGLRVSRGRQRGLREGRPFRRRHGIHTVVGDLILVGPWRRAAVGKKQGERERGENGRGSGGRERWQIAPSKFLTN